MRTISSVLMSVNPVHRKYSSHIDVRRHYIRELCLGNLVQFVPFQTNLMVTDTLTKNLPVTDHERHRRFMMGQSDFQGCLLHAVRGG